MLIAKLDFHHVLENAYILKAKIIEIIVLVLFLKIIIINALVQTTFVTTFG